MNYLSDRQIRDALRLESSRTNRLNRDSPSTEVVGNALNIRHDFIVIYFREKQCRVLMASIKCLDVILILLYESTRWAEQSDLVTGREEKQSDLRFLGEYYWRVLSTQDTRCQNTRCQNNRCLLFVAHLIVGRSYRNEVSVLSRNERLQVRVV